MTWVAGADGCKGGWVVVLREIPTGRIDVRTVDALSTVLKWQETPEVLCVDIPIGLLDAAAPGGRECDKDARALLGQPRGRSVFSPPVRAALKASSFEEALLLNRSSSTHGIGISRQCFGILPKIREIDAMMSPPLQDRVIEVHPEVSFYEMNGARSVIPSKKSRGGRAHRLILLESWCGCKLGPILDAHRSKATGRDDILDAMVACWSAFPRNRCLTHGACGWRSSGERTLASWEVGSTLAAVSLIGARASDGERATESACARGCEEDTTG